MIPFPIPGPAFRPLAMAFVPDLAGADRQTWDSLEATIASALGSRPPAIGEQLRLFVRIVDLLSRLRFGRRLHRLDAGQLARLMTALERAPFRMVRKGVWGLRTLVLMGYYTQPAVIASLGYHADKAGWAARR